MNKNTMKSLISKTFGFNYREIKVEGWNGGRGFIWTWRGARFQGDVDSKRYWNI